jgi:hypothetical protein
MARRISTINERKSTCTPKTRQRLPHNVALLGPPTGRSLGFLAQDHALISGIPRHSHFFNATENVGFQSLALAEGNDLGSNLLNFRFTVPVPSAKKAKIEVGPLPVVSERRTI